MRKNKIQFFTISCKGGCGKEITTTNRSIHGLDALHTKYSGYCSVCSPLNEHEIALKQGQGQALVDKFATKYGLDSIQSFINLKNVFYRDLEKQ